ncbi:hypothetical protein [Cellulosilyticum sp. I15G10I2]|uniref:hypothetical protein n=1 Tax=Cellulosilyticum sp. I15G10I2 TaxID=1892843 RepID=UPI00149614D8|nr:hypothetical protein [Cellulosilyticum sp. I15G10I2]
MGTIMVMAILIMEDAAIPILATAMVDIAILTLATVTQDVDVAAAGVVATVTAITN